MSPSKHAKVLAPTLSFQRVVPPGPGPLLERIARDEKGLWAGREAPPPADGAEGISAVIVVHGMGQQLPFQTLDAVVEGLKRADGAVRPEPDPKAALRPQVLLAPFGEKELPRAELSLAAPQGGRRRVHLYEAYWAPLTEGRVTLRDVIGFLWSAARNGRRNAAAERGFLRVMFDKPVWFSKQFGAERQLTWALAVLLALAVLYAVTTAVFGAAVAVQPGSPWTDPRLVGSVTLVVGAALLLAGLFAVLMKATRRMVFFFALLAAVVAAGAAVASLFVAYRLRGWTIWDSWPGAAGSLRWLANPWVTGVFWALLSGASLYVRRLLVQYVGDVAAYVTPHNVDRFFELRQAIKKSVNDVFRTVYGHRKADGTPAYERIAVVGHSLGSVAAYDGLNAMINADALHPDARLHVVDRTCLLLTFGSPLDKTAFIFTAQGHDTGETREALAAAMQPLIQSYEFRRFPWVNVHAPADIISGALDLYDLPRDPDPEQADDGLPRVENVEDPEARTPLEAHVEYWRTRVVFERLHGALTAAAPTPA